jgi:hypothetical protein
MVATSLSSQNRFTGYYTFGEDSDLAVGGPDQRTLAPSYPCRAGGFAREGLAYCFWRGEPTKVLRLSIQVPASPMVNSFTPCGFSGATRLQLPMLVHA